MPELPEVETIVRELRRSARGKSICGIDCGPESGCHISDEGVWELSRIKNSGENCGLEILDISRRGKFIVMVLERDLRLVVHLRMTGRLMWNVQKGREKYLRAVIRFTDGTKLYFSDVRKFGRLWLCGADDYQNITGIRRLGAEPLRADYAKFTKVFFGVLNGRAKKGILKNSLLRQDLLTGIGNIYADEICFRSGLHPLSRIENLGEAKKKELFVNIKKCLEEGIRHCGVSVSDFVGTKGDLGRHQNYLKIYGRAGDQCYVCGSPIKKIRVAGRGTHVCEKCQVRK